MVITQGLGLLKTAGAQPGVDCSPGTKTLVDKAINSDLLEMPGTRPETADGYEFPRRLTHMSTGLIVIID